MANVFGELFTENSVDKQLKILYDGETMENEQFFGESMELKEILCDQEELRFGECYASAYKITVLNNALPLVGKTINVSFSLAGATEPYSVGIYKVDSDKPTADREYRDIIAYDAMYDILNADVSAWYNTILPTAESTVTLKQFRDSFMEHFELLQEEVTLANDDMIIERTIEPSQLSGKDVITAICEINGCFGHIGRDGKFQYIHLKELIPGVYPSSTLFPSKNLYPTSPTNAERISKSHYSSCQYEDFKTQKISKLLIRKDENDVGASVGDGDNCYIVEDNFLLYGKGTEEMTAIAGKMFSVIKKVSYRPATVEAVGNPCLEVGDGIRLSTTHEIVYTYILQRTLKGIQALKDSYTAEGVETYTAQVNGLQRSIKQLKGKTNKLEMTIEETRLEMADIEEGLSNRITITAAGLETEVIRATAAEGNLSTRITQNASSISAEVTRAKDAESTLSSRVTLTENSISAEVTRATAAEGNLSGQISVNAQNILLKVSKNNVIAEINLTTETAVIKAPKIDLKGLVQATEFQTEFAKIGYATIAQLNVVESAIISEAEIENLIVTNATIKGKLDAEDFNSTNISAMNITARTISGNIEAEQVNAGAFTMTGGSISITTDSNYDNRIVLQGPSETCSISPHGVVSSQGYFSKSLYFEGCKCEWKIIDGIKYLVTEE